MNKNYSYHIVAWLARKCNHNWKRWSAGTTVQPYRDTIHNCCCCCWLCYILVRILSRFHNWTDSGIKTGTWLSHIFPVDYSPFLSFVLVFCSLCFVFMQFVCSLSLITWTRTSIGFKRYVNRWIFRFTFCSKITSIIK